jgi:hypothetical protein
VIQYENCSVRFVVLETRKAHICMIKESIVDNPTLVFTIFPKIIFLTFLKVHYHDAKFTCPSQTLVLTNECSAINNQEFKAECLVDCCGRIGNSFETTSQISLVLTLDFDMYTSQSLRL